MLALRPFRFLRRFASFTLRADLAPVERAFINDEVQTILKELTESDFDKLFKRSQSTCTDAPEIKLMTREEFEKCRTAAIEKRISEQLRMPPILEGREEPVKILEVDSALDGHNKSRMVFVDISLGIAEKDRLVWSRETDGTLKTTSLDERRRFAQIFINRPYRSPYVPPMFFDPHLQAALDKKFYDYILRRACFQFEPDDPEFIRVCQRVYMYVDEQRDYHHLHSTCFYGPMLFYLAWLDRMDNVLCFYLLENKRQSVLKLLRLYKLLHPNSELSDKPDTLDDLLKAYMDAHCKKKDALLEAMKGKQQEESATSSS